MFFAQDPVSVSVNWVGPIIQLVTAGGFGALVWYLVVKHIPAIEERHRLERAQDEARWMIEREVWKAERREWLDYIRKRDEAGEKLAREFLHAAVLIETYIKKEQGSRRSGKKTEEGES